MREDCLTKSVLAVFVMAMVSVSLHFYAVSRREAKIRSREVKFNAEEKGKNREEEDKLNKKLFKAWILIIALGKSIQILMHAFIIESVIKIGPRKVLQTWPFHM